LKKKWTEQIILIKGRLFSMKKTHFNWLVAHAAEKQLKYFRKSNASKRQNLNGV
jgi:hypothetical protein